MKRFAPRLLAAYAVSMSMLTAWLGCRAYVYGRLLGAYSTNSPADHAQIIANWNAPLHLRAPLDPPAMLFASLEPANLAAAIFVIFLAFMALAPKEQKPPTNNHSPEDRPACPS